MAFGYRCTNCGFVEEDHDLGLFEEPAEGDFSWIEEKQPGYRLTILQCMSTPWSVEHKRRIQRLYPDYNRRAREHGYKTPNPRAEQTKFNQWIAQPTPLQSSAVVIYNPNTGGSWVIRLE